MGFADVPRKRCSDTIVLADKRNRPRSRVEVKLPRTKLLSLAAMSEAQFNAEIEKGLADLAAGNVVLAERVAERMQRDYELHLNILH